MRNILQSRYLRSKSCAQTISANVPNGPPLTLKSWESWIEEKWRQRLTSYKNAMRLYATELICSMGIFGFSDF